MAKKEFNTCLLYLLIGWMIITGTINTVSTKVLQKTKSLGALFENHQMITAYWMFFGEMASLIGYACVVYREKAKKGENKAVDSENLVASNEEETDENGKPKLPPANNFVFMITASCDLTATTIGTFGWTYLSTSMYQMFRGMELMWIMIFSRVFLKNLIHRHHAAGVGTVLLGLFFVGLNAIIGDGAAVSNPLAGILLLCVSQLFSATQYIIQEKILTTYTAHAFQLVGFEGLWGVVEYTVLLIIFYFCRCDTWGETVRQGVCVSNETGEWRIEDTLFAGRQLAANWQLTIIVIFYVISIALYNIVGINLTKLVSSTARAIVDTVRTVFVWWFFLIWPWVPEGSKETFGFLQLLGFILLILGMLIYNEIWTTSYMNFNYWTRDEVRKRQILLESEGKVDEGNGWFHDSVSKEEQ